MVVTLPIRDSLQTIKKLNEIVSLSCARASGEKQQVFLSAKQFVIVPRLTARFR
jgi:hypothetical protein